MQTSMGTQSIPKRLEQGSAPVPESVILAFSDNPKEVKLAGAGETKLIGIAAPNGEYSGPMLQNQTGTRPGMIIDVITEGIAICLFGASAPEYGKPVKPDAQGRAIKASAGDTAIGICDAEAAEGDYGRVQIRIHKV